MKTVIHRKILGALFISTHVFALKDDGGVTIFLEI